MIALFIQKGPTMLVNVKNLTFVSIRVLTMNETASTPISVRVVMKLSVTLGDITRLLV